MDLDSRNIISITLNPVLDISGEVFKIIPNEKNYIINEKRYPGGNGINVARVLSRLGAKVLATGFLGGSTGAEMLNLIKAENIPSKFIEISGNTRFGVTISSTDTNEQTRLSFSGPNILEEEFIKIENELLSISKACLIILGGSFPEDLSNIKITDLLCKLKAYGHQIIIDVPGKDIGDFLLCKPLLIKPNLIEYQALVHMDIKTIDEAIATCEKLLEDVEYICISSIEGGALLIGHKEIWFGKIPKVKVKTTVGAGDSMVAAMSFKIQEYTKDNSAINLEETLRWGLAAACATLITTGTKLAQKENILKFLPEINLKRIK
jgi:1-phosphofructokinase family hexose kinase